MVYTRVASICTVQKVERNGIEKYMMGGEGVNRVMKEKQEDRKQSKATVGSVDDTTEETKEKTSQPSCMGN
jgi:hypothetical protein